MKQATLQFSWIAALLSAIFCAGCGNNQATFNQGSGDQPLKPVTKLKYRCLVTNFYADSLAVVDAAKVELTAYAFQVGFAPTYMQSSPDGTLTFVNNSGAKTISVFDNRLESVKQPPIPLTGWTQSFVTTADNKRGYAAVYDYFNGSTNKPGAILPFNPTDGSVNAAIPFPNVLNLAMNPAETRLLAFTGTDDNARWVDVSVSTPTVVTITDSSNNPLPLSRPVAAFFSADGTRAYILSCGFECGGSSGASVTEISTASLDATGQATVLNQWLVSGARIGMIDNTANKLYVAGSTASSTAFDCLFPDLSTCTLLSNGGHNVQDGYLTVITLSSTPANESASPRLRIGNGIKQLMRDVNGILWVGSLQCGVESCISLVDPIANTVQVLTNNSNKYKDATGITLANIAGNSADKVYTIEGGDLFVYNQTGTPFLSQNPTDIFGQASDVLYIH